MNKIKDAFNNKKAFIPFITGGDPSVEITKELILAMQEAGRRSDRDRNSIFRSDRRRAGHSGSR